MIIDQILDEIPLQHNEHIQYAGFWIRVAAYFIDYLIICCVDAILVLPFVVRPDFMQLWFFVVVLADVFYFPAMESSSKQATLGKMAVGIKVGNKDGERISFANAFGRFFAKIISGLIFYIGYMMAGWDSHKQALHDKIANTYVFYS